MQIVERTVKQDGHDAQIGREWDLGVIDPQLAASRSGLEILRGILARELPAPPAAGAMDIWLRQIAPGRAVFEGRPSRRFYNPLGTVHGGWIATLVDSALGCAVQSLLPAGRTYTTIELKTNFIRALFESDQYVRCEAVVVHAGSRTAVAEGKVLDHRGKLIATGHATCLVFGYAEAAGTEPKSSPRTP